MDQRRRRRRRGRRQTRRRRKRNLLLKMIILIILIVGTIAALLLWKKYGPSKETADLNKYYGVENDNQLAIVVNNQIIDPKGMITDGKAYVEYSVVRDYINERFYWDPNENTLLYTLPNGVVSVGVGSKDYSVGKEKNSEEYVIVKSEGSTAYIALDFVKQYTNMDFEVYDKPSRVMVNTETGSVDVAQVKRDTQVRYQGGVKSPILTEVKKNDKVRVIEDEGDWKKVRTEDGFIGYIAKRSLKDVTKEKISRDFKEPEYTNISKDYTINMAWSNVTNTDANSGILQLIAQTKGLTTLSPTWFHVADTDGDLESIASTEVVNYAHQANIEVWAAIRDFDGGINSYDESYELLSHTSSRTNLINQIISTALSTGIDGINVDFEKISEKCGEHYIQFIRELSVKCRQNGLVLSVDNYVPQAYNQQYHRKEQGVFADYVVIMGYDEHYGGSPEAGSVASYDYVKNGVEQTVKEVPSEKVISGIPFFTRVWKETPKTDAELAKAKGTDNEDYTMNVESTAYGMAEAQTVVEQVGVTAEWDDKTKQNYATWEADGSTYEVWLEDAESLAPKLQLIKDYNLAGSAAWRLGQETSDIWDVILKYVN